MSAKPRRVKVTGSRERPDPELAAASAVPLLENFLERDAKLLTLQEAADRLGLGRTPRAVYALGIPRTQLSPRRTRWAAQDVDAYIASRRQVPPARQARAVLTSVNLTVAGSGLRDAFRRAGVEPKPRKGRR